MLTCFVLLKSRKEKFILLMLSLKICLLKIAHLSTPSIPKSNSHLMTSPLPKKPNPEKQKPSKIQHPIKNVAIGLQIKINDTIGSLSYIINTSLTNISEELTGSLNPWPISYKQERLNSVDLITKKWKRSTGISPKSSWVLDSKITILMKIHLSSPICTIRVMTSHKFRSCLLNNSKTSLRHQVHNKNKTKFNPEFPK